jgi:hypothetical protein
VAIKHGPIKSDSGGAWIKAMTMELQVPKKSDFQVGMKDASIIAVVVSRASDLEYWIEEVRIR